MPVVNAKLYIYNESYVTKIDSVKVIYVQNHLNIKNPNPNNTVILFDKELNTKYNYKLILNNSDIYYVNKFIVTSVERYTAITQKKLL